ncbi:MAG: nitronate monooxygenase, partial [Planctomycetes bacterium]|nr:nitronate monooxygenase [Planctomycetota bacterium]
MPALKIGNLEISPPIIQGGMGVRVSRANLASAVANTGCAGIIASVGLGLYEDVPGSEFVKINGEALRYEIRKAKSQSSGIIGVNILVALSDYDNLVKVSVEEDVDLIISGAGLPLNLPGYLNGKDIKLIPVVSSARTFNIICKRWKNHFNKVPDAVIVEGVRAGGHLGYSYESIVDDTAPTLEQTVKEIVEIGNSFEPSIPVIAAGGIFDGEDIAHFLKLGASGVQMATRFVCTDECDAHNNFKQAYLDAKAEDLTIIKSPVGLPGRVINNSFVEKIKQGETMPFTCNYRCLKTCEPKKAPYCIAKVLANAAHGELDESFAFAGSNAYK